MLQQAKYNNSDPYILTYSITHGNFGEKMVKVIIFDID